MWVSTEAARKAANGSHIAVRIDNLQYAENTDGKSRVGLMVGSLKKQNGWHDASRLALPIPATPRRT